MNFRLRFGPRRASFRRPLFRRRTGPAHDVLTGPIRGELLGVEGLAERARKVARAQRLRPFDEGDRRTPLLTRLDETRQILETARARLTAAADAERTSVRPASGCSTTSHVVQEHMREVRESLPRRYYRELPELAERAARRLSARLRARDHADLAHRGPRRPRQRRARSSARSRRSRRSRIGELWAVPAMLRLGLIENVRRMALRTVQRLDEVEEADAWAARIAAAGETTGRTAARRARRVRRRHAAAHRRPSSRASSSSSAWRDGALPPLARLEQWIARGGAERRGRRGARRPSGWRSRS